MVIIKYKGCGFSLAAQRQAASELIKEILEENFLLGAYSYSLSKTPKGKPMLDIEGMAISVSHSGALCAVAVSGNEKTRSGADILIDSPAAEIGLDIERVDYSRKTSSLLKIAEKRFSENERRLLYSAAENEQIRQFYRIWTAKEALCKATGEGLAGLSKYDTCSMPEGFCLKEGLINFQNSEYCLSLILKKEPN